MGKGWDDMRSGEKFTLAVIAALVLFIAGSIAFHSHTDSPITATINGNTLSYQQLAAIFDDMGITGVTDEILDELKAHEREHDPDDLFWNKPADLLCWIGQGDYNDDWEWSPNNDTVYSFDTEVFELSKMYTNFLIGISYIGQGELDFANINEDLSHINEEKGTGYRTVSFDWNGERFTITAQEMNDWFDLDFATQLNQIIMTHGGEKHLYFADDNYQFSVVFYRDAQWAKEFTQRTGCKLSTDCAVGSAWQAILG